VGSAHDAGQDQVLDEILVGPVPVGLNKFVLQADPPNPSKLIASMNLLGVTVVLVTCSYREREFVRVGYYVNNEYIDPNHHPMETPSTNENNNNAAGDTSIAPPPPKDLNLQYVQRQILADKPRVTKFPIPWGSNDDEQEQQPPQEQPSFIMDDAEDNHDYYDKDDHPQRQETMSSSILGSKFHAPPNHHQPGGTGGSMAVDQQLQGTPMTDMDTSMDD
jgi:histone chaperone ASF1